MMAVQGDDPEGQDAGQGDDGPPAADEFVCTNAAVRIASRRLGLLYDDHLAPSGLTSAQVRLMSRIGSPDGKGPTLHELAARVGILLSALTHALKPLTRDGLVAIDSDVSDGRVRRARLTAAGADRLAVGLTLWAEANRRVEAVLGADRAGLLRLLAEDVSSEDFGAAFRDARPLAARSKRG